MTTDIISKVALPESLTLVIPRKGARKNIEFLIQNSGILRSLTNLRCCQLFSLENEYSLGNNLFDEIAKLKYIRKLHFAKYGFSIGVDSQFSSAKIVRKLSQTWGRRYFGRSLSYSFIRDDYRRSSVHDCHMNIRVMLRKVEIPLHWD